jgi:SAM-dependent methyltransferase
MNAKNPHYTTAKFWDIYAHWYGMWLNHVNYHKDILNTLLTIAKPGWRVLDIGAGSGVLALPLLRKNCRVTALEPSAGMRALIHRRTGQENLLKLNIDKRSWEETDPIEFQEYDLVIACNSLQFCDCGFRTAIEKVFATGARNIVIISEHLHGENLFRLWEDFSLVITNRLEAESSFAYHSPEEPIAHYRCRNGREPDDNESERIRSELVYRDGHYWKEEVSQINLLWWQKKPASFWRQNENGFHMKDLTSPAPSFLQEYR